MKRNHLAAISIIIVLILDQILKFYIKTNFAYGEGFNILGLEWARIHFVENKGMAFGMAFGGDTGKLILSIFRILMVGFLFYVLSQMIKLKESKGLVVSFALIIAGAIGNIVDSAFYGIIFSDSNYHSGPATFMPEEGGYSSFLHGKVVDMFYFPMYNGTFPDWFPIWSGENFEFFRPVFNVADASISVGVFFILIFYRSFFNGSRVKEHNKDLK